MKYDSRLHKRRRRLLHAFGEGVGGAPAGFGYLTLNGKVLQLNGKNLMLENT